MKSVDDVYTIKGLIPVNTANVRVALFDGRFDTAYRVESIEIVGSLPMITSEYQMILSTEPLADSTTFNFGDNTQIGWAIFNAPSDYSGPVSKWIDPDNLVVEDLFLSCRGSSDNTFCNYIVTMQKYEITEWRGALCMVRNRSQAAP